MTQQYDIHAFIFDLDGVLTDTSEYHYLGWQRFCDDEDIPFGRQRNEALRGVHRGAAMRMLLGTRDITPEQFTEMTERKNKYYLEHLDNVTPANVLPGARDMLLAIRAAGLKIAVGSASKNAPQVIERLGIAELIDAISDGNSVEQSKPEPDIFLHAAEQIGVDPKACVVVEDAEAGVAAAHNGGMRCIGLGPEERVGQADLVFPDLSNATLDGIMSALIMVQPPQV